MKITGALAIAFVLTATSPNGHARVKGKDALCPELKAFLGSVKPDDKRAVTLRTFWGAREEGDQIVISSRQCLHDEYEPGKKLCAYFMENTSSEFAGTNAKRVLNCLAPQQLADPSLQIHSGSFSSVYGSPDRGAFVDLQLTPDKEFGGMALRVEARGY